MTSFLKLITFKVVVRELYKIFESYFTRFLIMKHFEIDVCTFGHLITDFITLKVLGRYNNLLARDYIIPLIKNEITNNKIASELQVPLG